MDEQKQKLIERIKQAQNILVTVSTNPTVDQLSAAIGLTLALNKLDKHGTAVFSGQIPSTIEFLKPEETLEKNTDSLRDFIIALDKSKADKLRYKVEDQVVRIFITPYKTSLSEQDLEFSQGDFNVDVVVALGVAEQQDLDAAITAHGRILHDATVASVSTSGQGSLGTINWVDSKASSLSEMMTVLVDGLDKKILDNQIATALLTGIVASTERFSNEKTTPKTMSASSALMAAGANQQLIATELETPPVLPESPTDQQSSPTDTTPTKPHKRDPGTLEIDHEAEEQAVAPPEPEPAPEPPEPQIHVDEDGQLLTESQAPLPQISQVHGVDVGGHPDDVVQPEVKRERLTEPPKMGDVNMTANIADEDLDPSTEELTLPAVSSPLLSHNESVLQPPAAPSMVNKPADPFIPQAPLQPAPPAWQPPVTPEPSYNPPAPTPVPPVLPPAPDLAPSVSPFAPAPALANASPYDIDETLADIEKSVDSPHVHIDEHGNLSNASTPPAPPAPIANVDDARSAVEAALNSAATPGSDAAQPIAALHAQPLGPELHPAFIPQPPAMSAPSVVPNTGFSEPTPGNTPADDALDMPLPSNPFGPGQQVAPQAPMVPANPLMGTPQSAGLPGTPPPPVPPPMLPPLQ
ncbi:MAG TPA: hypothetical protein VLG92_00435 [Candidatus Saccharimonadia bacterium]|nr:hypothetical protein [Candidatus Saccharimonadia bacterium]